jgi:hypothetical protein
MSNPDDLRYPTGKFSPQDSYTPAEVKANIERIENLPEKVKALVNTLSPAQLDTAYREEGWTARQVIHHLADSHMNAYVRFKWTLTESTPVIKAYNEKLWAETPETTLDPSISVNLLVALHKKLTLLLKNLGEEDLKKEFTHPDTKKQVSVARLIALYAWHGEHHLGHIRIVAAKK